MSLEKAFNLITQHGAIILDIRTYKEFCSGHLSGALFVPTQLPPLSKREEDNLRTQLWNVLRQQASNKNQPIIVYCKKGIRAGIAKKMIESLGFTNVVSLGGVTEPPLLDLFTGKNKMWPICRCYSDQ